MIGTVLGESAIPLVAEKHAELLFDRHVPIELEAALCDFVAKWWSHPARVAVMFTIAHERRNAQIIERHRQLALAQEAEEKTGRPLRTAGPSGTRRARTKRKRAHGR